MTVERYLRRGRRVRRNARKADAALRFEVVYRAHLVAFGRVVVRDDRERGLLRRQIDHLEDLRRHEHARRADGPQLRGREERSRHDVGLAVLRREPAHGRFDAGPQMLVVLAILRHDVLCRPKLFTLLSNTVG